MESGADLFEVEVEHVAVDGVEVGALADGVGGPPVRTRLSPVCARREGSIRTGTKRINEWGNVVNSLLDVSVVVAVVIVLVEVFFFRPGGGLQKQEIRTSSGFTFKNLPKC